MAQKFDMDETMSILARNWVVLSFAFAALVYGIRADAKQQVLVEHDITYQHLLPERERQLATIQSMQKEEADRLDRMDSKIDTILERTK